MATSCLFCKIVAGDIKSDKVFEDDLVMAFNDIQPVAPVHVLIIPRSHVQSVAAFSGDDAALMSRLLTTIGDLARSLGIESGGYRVVTNHGEHAGQSVPHLHFHLLGGRAMSWPPG